MKRILSLLLAMVLLIGVMPLGAQAVQGGKLIALTFDDGPDPTDTPRLLDGLAQREVKATFFTLGENSQRYLDIVRRAYAEGHEIACHSWDHPDLRDLSDSEIRRQVEDSMAVLDRVCGVDADYLFRPPYGGTNAHVRSLIRYPLIHWSIDPEDWKYRDPDTVRDSVVRDAYDGAIILVHDIHSTTVDGILEAIDILKNQGYEFVTVSELYRRRNVPLKNGETYYDCKNNGTDYGPIAAPEISYTTDHTTMEVTLSTTSTAPIYYTTDGTIPNEQSKRYEGPFTVNYPGNIHAVAAYQLNGSRSDMAVLAPGETPSATPEMEVKDFILTLTCETKDANIYYTVNGSDPKVSGILYEGPVKVTGSHEIRAVSGGGYYKMSRELRLYCSKRGELYADMTPDDWYFEPIDRMVSQGLMAGVGNHKVAPNAKLTRGMLVQLLYRYSGDQLEASWKKTNGFTDYSAEDYYAEAIEWAYRHKIVSGYSKTRFNPDGNVTRQELCKVVDRFLTYRNHPLPAGESCKGKFADYNQIQDWAISSVEAMVSAGLITGDGKNMNPRGNATRGQVATILVQMMDYEDTQTPPVPEPTEKPTEPPTEKPTEPATEAPTAKPTESPTVAPTEAPTEKPTEKPTEPPTEAPTILPTEVPTAKPTESPTEKPTEPSTEAPTEAPTEEPTERPHKPIFPFWPTEEATEPSTEAPTEKPTEPSTEAPTEKPTEPSTEAPTEKPTEPSTEAPTEKPTEPSTEKPTEPKPTQPKPTEPKPTEKPSDPGMEGFCLPSPMPAMPFRDVQRSDWFYDDVHTCYALNLMKGTGDTEFSPRGKVSVAQAVYVAVRIHERYYGLPDKSQGWPGPWYQYGLDKAREYGILPEGVNLKNPERPAFREEVAAILAHVLPSAEFAPRNQVTEIPDYRKEDGARYAEELLRLYNAGVLAGADAYGCFFPDDVITRAELSTMLCRVVQPQTRRSFTLKTGLDLHRMIYGTSGAGRNLVAYRYGSGSKTAVFCFCIHGWEDDFNRDGEMLVNTAREVRGMLVKEYADLIAGKDWSVYILPCLNPDGLWDGYSHNGPGRCTTHILNADGKPVPGNDTGIDMNRCFPYCFNPSYNSRNYTGDHPLGAIEAKSLAEFVQRVRGTGKSYLVDTHGWYDQIIGNTNGVLCRSFSNQFACPYSSLSGGPGYFSAWVAYEAGYDEACLFEFPYITSESQFRNENCAGRYCSAVRSLLKNG